MISDTTGSSSKKEERLDACPAIGAGGLTALSGALTGMEFGAVTPMTGLAIDLRVSDFGGGGFSPAQDSGFATTVGADADAGGIDPIALASAEDKRDENEDTETGRTAPNLTITATGKRKRDEDTADDNDNSVTNKRTATELPSTPLDALRLLTATRIISTFTSQPLLTIDASRTDKTQVLFFYFDLIHDASLRQILHDADRATHRTIVNAACTALFDQLAAVETQDRSVEIKMSTILSQFLTALEHFGIGPSTANWLMLADFEEGKHRLHHGTGLIGEKEMGNWAFYRLALEFQMYGLDPEFEGSKAERFEVAGKMLEALLLGMAGYCDVPEEAVEESLMRHYARFVRRR